jgi:CRISPR-associated protein Cmr4
MQTRILYLFTRTPLHVGAGASVGAIDQPVQRERHTGFPIVPGTSIKGSLADQWNDGLVNQTDQKGKSRAVRVNDQGEIAVAAWLFGSDSDKPAFAGSLVFSEARVLAFPIRSARGSYSWITCPLLLKRAKRDGAISGAIPTEPGDNQAIFKSDGPLALGTQIVLEDYTFDSVGGYPADLAAELAKLIADDELLQGLAYRLVIVSDDTMSHFATTACEVAQHVRISDETGTAEHTGLFNQENVPADTLFYSVLSATHSRVPNGELKSKTAEDALNAFCEKVHSQAFQFGGDASTGLGWCSLCVAAVSSSQA